MIMDELLLLSENQAVTADAASTNVIPLSVAREIGRGQPVYMHVSVDVATDDTTGDETYVLNVETDADAAFSDKTILAQLTIPRGAAAGYHDYIEIPNNNVEAFLRAFFDVGGTTPTGTFTVWISNETGDTWKAYDNAVN